MKKMIWLLFCAALIVCPETSFSQTRAQRRKTERLFRERTEVYFQFNIQDRSEIHELTDVISIDNVKGLTVFAYANKEQFLRFLTLGYRYRILPNPSSLQEHPTGLGGNRDLGLTAYPTYAEYVTMMEDWAAAYPEICTLVNIGTTTEGRSLLMLKITDNPAVREYEPQFLYTATMHGDETTGYILMLEFIDWILSGYGSDADATDLVNSMELWINPLANPDGTYSGGNNTINGATRANANNVDLNRNYPDPQDGAHPDGNAYQAETIAFMNFAEEMDFVAAVNFHGGAEVYNYPWDTKPDDHPDRNWWMDVGQAYVDAVWDAANNNGYFTDNEFGFDGPGLTNGYAWYEVNGGRQDYMNTWHHCREATLEVSLTKTIPVSQFTAHWNYNKQALIDYPQVCFDGFHGLITDACTGNPVQGKVFVNNHDADSSHVYASMPIGNYYRPIYPGNYSVTFSAPGYESQTISNLSITANASLELNIQLQPLAPQAAFTADAGSSCGAAVQFTDESGSASSWLWDFGDGNTSTEANPFHAYSTSGIYDVSLTVTNCAGSNTLAIPALIDAQVIDSPLPLQASYSSCEPSSFVLEASALGDIFWYSSEQGGDVLASGPSFTTPVLSQSQTYFVESSVTGLQEDAAIPDNTIGAGGYYNGPTYHYLAFDAFTSFTIAQVKVYAGSAGQRTIELRDASSAVLASATINIPAGESYIDLNFPVTPGIGYQLGTAGQNGLFRNQGGATFPYALDGVLSITGTSANDPTYYYYFYDWKIESRCTSARIPVVVEIEAGDVQASISSSQSIYCEGDQLTVAAESNLADAQYAWYVNDVLQNESSSVLTLTASADASIFCVIATSDLCGAAGEVSTNTLSLQVEAIPATPVITYTEPDLLASSASSGNQWYLDGNLLPGATGQTYTALDNGVYTVVVNNGPCVSPVSEPVDVIIFSLEENTQSGISIFPNPVEDQLILNAANVGEAELRISDLSGRLIYQTKFNGGSFIMDASAWPHGSYTLQMIHEAGSEVRLFQVK